MVGGRRVGWRLVAAVCIIVSARPVGLAHCHAATLSAQARASSTSWAQFLTCRPWPQTPLPCLPLQSVEARRAQHSASHLSAKRYDGSGGSSTACPATGVCTSVRRPASSCVQRPRTAMAQTFTHHCRGSRADARIHAATSDAQGGPTRRVRNVLPLSCSPRCPGSAPRQPALAAASAPACIIQSHHPAPQGRLATASSPVADGLPARWWPLSSRAPGSADVAPRGPAWCACCVRLQQKRPRGGPPALGARLNLGDARAAALCWSCAYSSRHEVLCCRAALVGLPRTQTVAHQPQLVRAGAARPAAAQGHARLLARKKHWAEPLVEVPPERASKSKCRTRARTVTVMFPDSTCIWSGTCHGQAPDWQGARMPTERRTTVASLAVQTWRTLRHLGPEGADWEGL